MADPVSIIGTAVGVTSLGVQVCQAVIQYYSQFRSFDDEITAIVTRAEVLAGTLEALESVRAQIGIHGDRVSDQLQCAIATCASSLAALNAMVRKCGETKLPVSTEDKRRLLKKRLLWPFRQETLTNLRTALDELQANVQLAMQVFSL
jgi:hypothetical protein